MCFYGKILVNVAANVIPVSVFVFLCGAQNTNTTLLICAYVGMERCVGTHTEKVE